MKERGYKVRVEDDRVVVEHRASFSPRTIAYMAIAYACYCILVPGVRKTLRNFYASQDPIVGCFALFFLLIPFLAGASWFFFASGEVMCCDAQQLHFAKRRLAGRWHRCWFASREIRNLRQESRGGHKNRYFTVLTFQCGGHSYDMLEDLDRDDSNRILQACKLLGVDTLITTDVGEAMFRDIEQRGWFINSLKPDHDEKTSTKA